MPSVSIFLRVGALTNFAGCAPVTEMPLLPLLCPLFLLVNLPNNKIALLARRPQSMEARRPVPPLSAALASMRDTCEVFGVPPLLDPDLAAAFAYFAEHGDAIRASGVGEVRAAMPAPGTRPPWTAWRNAIEPMMGGSWSEQNPPDLAHTAELRLGMALWRLTRLEFTEMIPEDFRFAILWLTRPGSAAKTDALGALKLFVDALNKAAATVPKHLIRSRCEVATTLWAPKPEPPESVGDLPWGKYAENGTPNPVPRPGRFTLFARLPKEGPAASASARTSARGGRSGTLDETASVEEAARALVAAGLAASFSVADWGEERGAAVLRGGAAGSGAALATLSVDHLNGPSPACSGPPRFGSLIIVNWLVEDGPTDQKKVTPKAVARALKKRFVPKARPATASTTGARAGPGTSTTTAASAPAATPAAAAAGVAAAAAASGSGDASDSSATAVTKVVRQTAWGACSIEHRVVRVSVDGHPDLILEATSGTGGGAPGEDRQMASQAVSTIWKLLRGEEEVRGLTTGGERHGRMHSTDGMEQQEAHTWQSRCCGLLLLPRLPLLCQ